MLAGDRLTSEGDGHQDLDRIDEIVPPGTDIGPLDQAQAYVPPAITKTELRRRPINERSAA